MARTNIDIDDALIAEAMVRFDLSTKREAVDLALRRLVGVPLTKDDVRDMKGVGWDTDLEALRRDDPWSDR